MFLRAEPWLKELSRRLFSPWKGNHVVHGDLSKATAVAAANVIPWGFVSQEKVLESVTPDRVAGGGKAESGKVEKRAEYLDLDNWEFLRGTEEAYRCTAKLFAQQHQHQHQLQSLNETTPTAAPAHGQAVDASGSAGASVGRDRRGCDGIRGDGGVVRGGASESVGTSEAGGSGRDSATLLRSQKTSEGGTMAAMTDFCDFDVASPQMSMFLNDVLESYRVQGLVPRLSVASVEAKLCKVGVRLGGISKNTNFLGLMSAEEAKYHLTMGMLGPEGVVMNEMEGRAPQRVIADVELTCEEEFVLEDGDGRVVHRPESRGKKVHYVTLQSNVGEGTDLEWQITNINDVIKPTYNYYFSRFGN